MNLGEDKFGFNTSLGFTKRLQMPEHRFPRVSEYRSGRCDQAKSLLKVIEIRIPVLQRKAA